MRVHARMCMHTQTHTQTDRHKHTHTHTHIKTDRQREREREAGRQAGRQTDRQTDRQKHTHTQNNYNVATKYGQTVLLVIYEAYIVHNTQVVEGGACLQCSLMHNLHTKCSAFPWQMTPVTKVSSSKEFHTSGMNCAVKRKGISTWLCPSFTLSVLFPSASLWIFLIT